MKLNKVGKKFKIAENYFWALKNINLDINKGEIATFLGPSGSGKSTLLNIIGGIEKADEGTLYVGDSKITDFNDKELTKYRRDNVGFVFQFYNLIPNLTVEENVEVATNISKNPLDVKKVLEAVDMLDKKNKFPSELSGGEQQRVSIARAIAKNPELLLCDEPTGALDFTTSKEILKLIERINKEFNTTVLIVTHNAPIADMADKVVRLRSGEITDIQINKNKISAEGVEW
ncbi:ABC transporter ATP-binding protein [Fervidicella metallireducens AeB]|uniref:ABC transporter ATP-binding protein n=1 Tax=Fervidicella metallireducens AeB TaxID=1403537 RepID=A0A017RVM1_9CLOT|nr:ABC transporter ATP-binding protein [Fervidicella metallireducens AeB]